MAEKKTASDDPKSEKSIDPKLVERLGEIATRLDLSEIEVVQGELKIRVARQIGVAAMPVAPIPTPVVATAAVAAPIVNSAASSASTANHPGAITSPMVGTAYLRPSPEAQRFVETGAQVKAGDTVMLIEAMKTFNEITAPRSGTIGTIFVDDGQPVEFGQPLIVIE
jgi:acetyl-CoA carboxylase biotin carboxyl carrier protein